MFLGMVEVRDTVLAYTDSREKDLFDGNLFQVLSKLFRIAKE